MKTILRLAAFVLVLLAIHEDSESQQISASYKVLYSLSLTGPDGERPAIQPLDMTCRFYQKGNRSISYFRNDYLSKYPDGIISLPGSQANSYWKAYLSKDSITYYNYRNHDSLLWVYTSMTPNSEAQRPYGFKYEPGYMKWDFLADTRQIGGLNCQRAVLYSDGMKQWDVWFCADIPVRFGPVNIFDLPGLMVEGENLSLNMKFSLINYDLTIEIPDSVFEPKVLMQPVIIRGTLRNRNK